MKHRIWFLLPIVTMLFAIRFTNISTSANSIQGHKGMTLDCARTYYSPKLIKGYINTLSKNKAKFVLKIVNWVKLQRRQKTKTVTTSIVRPIKPF